MSGGGEFLFWLLLFVLVIVAVAFTELDEKRRGRRDLFVKDKPEPDPRSSLEQFSKIIPKVPR